MQRYELFYSLDLTKGFHQIEIYEKDRVKTAFSVLGEKYQYKRMPFGMKNAPIAFQKVMTRIFENTPYVKIYIDDILIHSRTKEEHLCHLKSVLDKLEENNIMLNLEKCVFGHPRIGFLGKEIDKD